ncbi:MAG TPA: threonine synthase [Firmicutes bacterium]|nr:threonine synthase [Bacillota bacterium]
MQFISTRGEEKVTGAEAIVKGIAADGGLFVPASFPAVSQEELESMLGMDYPERAAFILHKYLDEYDKDELLAALKKAYAQFEGGDAAPLVRVENGMYMLELFHGPTCAFKDMALTVLPYLLRKGCDLCGIKEKILILVATSGDTGKAALEGFKDADGIKIMVFYPDDGVSKMQKLQMCTQEGNNVNVVAVKGNFDDCQTGVKKIFGSAECKKKLAEKGYLLSSANSINFGRLAPQICYYFSAYCDLVTSDQIKMGDKVNFTVPTGNFGNILAGYYAKKMGLPVGTLVCASNKNNVLTDFWNKGTYDVKRPFYKTMSPSMDILVSSNLERLIFELSGRDAALTKERMASLAATGRYSLRAEELQKIRSEFFAAYAGEGDTVDCIYEFFDEYGYPMDTHTGVAMSVAQRYEEKMKKGNPKEALPPMVVVSTASPYKFPQDVLYALTGNDVKDSFKGIKRINLLTAMKVPEALKAIRYKPILFKQTTVPDKMFDEVLKFV